ncbi:MAG: histidine phosphatase family protein [Chthoniobacterales bacterium]
MRQTCGCFARKFLAVVLFGAVCSAPKAFAEPIVFLVRHAEKAQNGDAKDPNLSDAGRARAQALAALLKDASITAIFATEFKRTQATAAPLAQAMKLQATIVPAKDTGALVAKLKQEHGNSLVVAHSDTIPEIARALGVTDSITLAETDYDNLFVIIRGSPAQLLRLHLPARD